MSKHTSNKGKTQKTEPTARFYYLENMSEFAQFSPFEGTVPIGFLPGPSVLCIFPECPADAILPQVCFLRPFPKQHFSVTENLRADSNDKTRFGRKFLPMISVYFESLKILPLLRSTANAPILWKIAPVTGEITPAAARKIITKLTENAITILA